MTVAPSTRALSPGNARALTRTLAILGFALASLAILEVAMFQLGWAQALAARLAGVPWLLILGAFMIAGWMARGLAHRVGSPSAQAAGLLLYVVAQTLILAPMLVWSERAVPGVLQDAIGLTAIGTLGLMAIGWWSRADFSFLRPFLIWTGWIALATIVIALLTGFRLGLWFSAGMILIAGASVLHDTSRLKRRNLRGREIANALELFASIAMLFWYVLRATRQIQR